MNYQNILTAHSSKFTIANTHQLKQGDVIRHYGMVIVVGEKQVSPSHPDNGYGECQYHISDVVATAASMSGITTWNVQGNKLAIWEKYNG